MVQPNTAEIQRFFELLYPDITEGYLVLSSPDPDPTHVYANGKRYLRSTWMDLAKSSIASVAAHAATYYGVVIQRPDCRPDPYHRSTNAGAFVVPGLWFDADLAYGQHAASALPTTDAEALDFLMGFQTPPSLILHSGGGLYGHWLFKEPYRIASEPERDAIKLLCARFAHTLVTAGKQRGWTLDALGDLARILRPPGSVNSKYGKLVEVLHESGARYNPTDFDWLLDLPAPVRGMHAGAVIPGQPDLVTIAEHYGTALERKSKTELAGAHPQHGSSTGDNFNINVDKGLWHCWRHGTGGDALALIAVCEGLVPCEEMRAGALHGELFKDVVALANQTFQAGILLGGQGLTVNGPGTPQGSVWDKAIPVGDFLAQHDVSRPALAQDLVVPGAITIVAAPRGTGKSVTALALGVALASGGVFRGEVLPSTPVLLVDRDNPPVVVRKRLGWLGAVAGHTLDILTRDDAPPLKDKAAWASFPVEKYAVVLIDSLGAATEGVSEKEGRQTQEFLATLKDLAHRGPAILALDNTNKAATSYRGRGEKADAVDILYEARDITGWTPNTAEAWWESLPAYGDHAWQQRATRRKGQHVLRIAFIPSKYRLGIEPEPFALEIDTTTTPWALADITAHIAAEGTQAAEETKRQERQHVEHAAQTLVRAIALRSVEAPILKEEAVTLLCGCGLSRKTARTLLESGGNRDIYPQGQWVIRPVPGHKSGKALGVYPASEGNDGERSNVIKFPRQHTLSESPPSADGSGLGGERSTPLFSRDNAPHEDTDLSPQPGNNTAEGNTSLDEQLCGDAEPRRPSAVQTSSDMPLPAFADFTASELWCATCQQAQPARLEGAVYRCDVCNTPVGTKTGTAPEPSLNGAAKPTPLDCRHEETMQDGDDLVCAGCGCTLF